MSARTWRRAFSIGQSDASVAPALRVGLAVTIVLVGGGILGRPDLAGFAALGALCSAFGRYEPYPRRAGKIAMIGALIIGFAVLGAVIGAAVSSTGVQVAALSIAAGIAALILAAFTINGPGPVILVFAATAAVGFSHDAAAVGTVFAAVSVGTAIGWVAAMLPALLHPVGPGQLAVARALAAVDSRSEPLARAAIARARTVVSLNNHARRRDHSLGLVTLLDDAEALLDARARGEDPGHAAAVLAHERALRKMRRCDLPVRAAELTTRPRSFFADGLGRLTDRSLVINAFRITAAAALAAWCATAFGFSHPLWAAMGALAAMQGIAFRTTVERGIQRLLGNVGGAIVGAGLIALSLGYWQTIVVIVVMQVAAELLVLKNYGLTSFVITPMALMLTGLASHLSPAVAVSRIGDTLIGVLIGIVIAAITIEAGDRQHLS
ncbi:FUSC family protein [Rhodococcus sp. P1Y]|nr:FUSC family protein [Rhodococcus sp. P1Y]